MSGLTQKLSETLISPFGFTVACGGKPSRSAVSPCPPCRASCFSQGETLREQVGEPAQRTGFSVVAYGKPLRVYDFPLPVRKSCLCVIIPACLLMNNN
ncbi:MAG: hypothetical protein KME40_22360 [Komarekiella atlantica HA4396-MV6]|nr:hypothetical protein [Komarekiella atlantica HA4396-MV6]